MVRSSTQVVNTSAVDRRSHQPNMARDCECGRGGSHTLSFFRSLSFLAAEQPRSTQVSFGMNPCGSMVWYFTLPINNYAAKLHRRLNGYPPHPNTAKEHLEASTHRPELLRENSWSEQGQKRRKKEHQDNWQQWAWRSLVIQSDCTCPRFAGLISRFGSSAEGLHGRKEPHERSKDRQC